MSASSKANFLDPEYFWDKGLEPLDFVKHTLPLEPEDVDNLVAMNCKVETLGLSKDHLYNVLGEEELSKLCFHRIDKVGSYLYQRELIAKVLDIQQEFIPDGLIEAQLELSREQSYGKRSYKNFLRRLNREYKKKNNIVKKHKKKDKGFLTIEHAPEGEKFTLKW